MISFIEEHRGDYGIEPICRVLPIAPSTFHQHMACRRDPSKLSGRAQRDIALKGEIERVFEENFHVYGVRKVWAQMKREGFDVARCTVERLMRDLGLAGVIRGKKIKTTIPDKAAVCPLDHVNRQFHAPAPNMLCLSVMQASPVGNRCRTSLMWRHGKASSMWHSSLMCSHDTLLVGGSAEQLMPILYWMLKSTAWA